jgi:tetratricopeptide (TPR) repeat protein
MSVIIQKESTNRWLNRAVVVLLIAIIAIELSQYLIPTRESARETVPPPTLAQQQESRLAREASREREEAGKKLEALSQRLRALEDATPKVVAALRDSFETKLREYNQRIAEQGESLARMTAQLDAARFELVFAKAKADVMAITGAEPLPVPALGQVEMMAPVQPPVFDLQPAATPNEGEYGSVFKKAEALHSAKKYKDAAAVFSALIVMRPELRAAYLWRGDCYGWLQDYDSAIADFGSAIRLTPQEARAYLARGWAYLGKGATEQATADLGEAIRLDPMLGEAHRIRAKAFDRKGQPEAARADRAAAVEAFFRRGVAAISKGDHQAGITDIERVLREAPKRAEAHTWCGKAFYLRRDFPGAIKEFTKVVALDPNNKETYTERGMAYFQVGDRDAALADFEHAIGLDPKFETAYLDRGKVRLAAGDAERAAADFSMVLQLNPHNAAAHRLRSVADDRVERTLRVDGNPSAVQSPAR